MIVQFPIDFKDEDSIAETINDLQMHLNNMIVDEAIESSKYDDPNDAVDHFKKRINKYAKLNTDEFEALQNRLFQIAEGSFSTPNQWQFSILVLRILTRNDPENRKRLTTVLSRSLEEG